MLGSNEPVRPSLDVHVGGSFTGQMAAGSDNTQVALNIQVGQDAGETLAFLDRALGIEPVPPPVDARLADFPDLVGRDAVLAMAEQPVAPPWVAVVGETGIGKTVLLRHLGGRWPVTRQPDGMAYLPAAGMVDFDVAYALFDLFFRTRPRGRPSRGELVASLGKVRAVVMLDDVDDQHLADTLALMRNTTFVVASQRPVLTEGTRVSLPGLDPVAGIPLVERGLGRPLRPDEREDAERLVTLLRGNPGDILREVASAAVDGRTVSHLIANLQQGDGIARLDPTVSVDETSVALAAAALGGVPVGREHLVAVTGDPAAVDALEHRGIVRSASPSLVLDRTWLSLLSTARELPEWHARWLDYFADWAIRPDVSPQQVSAETPALAQLLAPARFALDRGRAQRLVRAVLPALTLTSRWGIRRRLLELVLAGGSSNEPETMAWALHQIGTQDAVEGRLTDARQSLVSARDLRDRIGDKVGRAATDQNLAVLDALVTPLPRAESDRQVSSGKAAAGPLGRLLIPIVAGAGLLVVGIILWLLLNAGGVGASASPTDLTFATWQIGDRSPVQTVQITAGSQPIHITDVRIDEVTGFQLVEPLCTDRQLAARSSCPQAVVFTPTREGSAKAALVITIEGSNVPLEVNLFAEGTAASASATALPTASSRTTPPPSTPPPSEPANLVIGTFEMGSPIHEQDGWHVPVTVVVANRGKTDAPPFELALLRDVRSTDLVPFFADGQTNSVASTTTPLPPDGVVPFKGYALLPADSVGGVTIDVEADSCAIADPLNRRPCRVVETNEDDNSFRRGVEFPPGPDLVVLTIDRADAFPNQDPDGFYWDGSYVAVVRNGGTADSDAALIGVDVKGGSAELLDSAANEVGSLGPGQEQTIKGTFRFRSPTGEAELVLTVDPCDREGGCRIPELNEQNNATARTIDFPSR